MSNRPPKYAFGFTKPDPRTRFAFLLEAWSIYDRRPAEPTLGWRDLMEPVVEDLSPAMRALLVAHDEDALSLLRMRLRERLAAWRPVEAAVFDLRSLKTSGGEAGVYDRAFAARVVYAAHIGLGGAASPTVTADALREFRGCGETNKVKEESLTRNHVIQAVKSHLAREKSACEATDLPPELIFARRRADLWTVVALDTLRVWAEEGVLLALRPGFPRGAALAREVEATVGVASAVEAAKASFEATANARRGDPRIVALLETFAAGVERERRRLGVAEAA